MNDPHPYNVALYGELDAVEQLLMDGYAENVSILAAVCTNLLRRLRAMPLHCPTHGAVNCPKCMASKGGKATAAKDPAVIRELRSRPPGEGKQPRGYPKGRRRIKAPESSQPIDS